MEGRRILRSYRESAARLSFVVLFGVGFLGYFFVAESRQDPAFAGGIECIQTVTDNGEIKTVCRESSGGGGNGGGGGGGDSDVPTPHDYWNTPSCDGNVPPPENSAGVMCNRATITCELRGQEGILMDYYVQWEPDGPWERSGTWCSGTIDDEFDPDIEPEQVAVEMADHLLPDSNVRMSPANGRALTNFPVIFYAEEDEFSDSATLLGVDVEVRAQATEFQWTWGDGSSDSFGRPGIPFDGNASDPALVKHPYDSRGSYTADLVVTWNGEFRIAGEQWQELPEMTVDRGEAGDLTIRDQRNVLSD